MKQNIKKLLADFGFALRRLTRGQISGIDLAWDLRVALGTFEHPLCVDVGANDGGTIELLEAALHQPVIHAFEPNPEIFARLQERHGGKSGIHLVHAGVGATDTTLTLHLHDNHTLNSFLPLTELGQSRLEVSRPARTAQVQVIPLDRYAAEHAIARFNLLKIDTQGFELHVLRGADALFREARIDTVLLELNFASLYGAQADALEVVRFLREHGLELVDFYEKCRHGMPLSWCTALFARPPGGVAT